MTQWSIYIRCLIRKKTKTKTVCSVDVESGPLSHFVRTQLIKIKIEKQNQSGNLSSFVKANYHLYKKLKGL